MDGYGYGYCSYCIDIGAWIQIEIWIWVWILYIYMHIDIHAVHLLYECVCMNMPADRKSCSKNQRFWGSPPTLFSVRRHGWGGVGWGGVGWGVITFCHLRSSATRCGCYAATVLHATCNTLLMLRCYRSACNLQHAFDATLLPFCM